MPRGDILTKFPPLTNGVREDQAPHLLPIDASPPDFTNNVFMRDGWIVPRPGLSSLNNTSFAGVPTGTFFHHSNGGEKIVIGTTKSWYIQSGSGFTDLSGGALPLTGNVDDPQRFVEFPTGTPLEYRLVGVNGYANHPYFWDGTSATFVDLQTISATTVGTVLPPPAMDITTAGNRVILFNTYESGQPSPYAVRWCAFNDPKTWNGEDVALLVTPDPSEIVAGKALNRISFVVYKDESQYLATLQAGLYAFSFELQDEKPGPVSPAVIIGAASTGIHYYLGNDLDIYSFDGNHGVSIGRAVQRFLIRNLAYEKRGRCFALYQRYDRNIWFFYPSVQAAVGCDRAVSFNIDTQQWFPHSFNQEFTAGGKGTTTSSLTWTDLLIYSAWTGADFTSKYPTWSSMLSSTSKAEVLAPATGNPVKLLDTNAVDDDGIAFDCLWTTSTVAPADWSYRVRSQSIETYFSRASAAQIVKLTLKTTDSLLENPSQTDTVLTQTFDINTVPSQGPYELTFDVASPGVGSGIAEARFLVAEHRLTQTSFWKWGGAALRTYKQETD